MSGSEACHFAASVIILSQDLALEGDEQCQILTENPD